LNIGLQALFAIILIILLIFGNPRKVIYADQQ
jgi:Sec-independent protein translocase protein TatA